MANHKIENISYNIAITQAMTVCFSYGITLCSYRFRPNLFISSYFD